MKGSLEEPRPAFRGAFVTLVRRINLFACLPLDKLNGLALQAQLDDIGRR